MEAYVDTQLWSIAKKKPERKRFKTPEDFERALEAHLKARRFFAEVFPSLRVYMSLHQVAEIFHVLAFRGSRVPPEEAAKIIYGILDDSRIVKVPLTAQTLREAVRESVETGIHIWDFTCLLPVRNLVNIIYSADQHFKTIGKKHGIKVENPIGYWVKS